MRDGFTIEFFAMASGDEPVRAFLLALSAKARQKCITYIDLLGMMGLALHASHIKKLDGDIWELRPEFGGTEYRIFFGRHGETFVLLHAMTKKRQKAARSDIILAQRRFNECLTAQAERLGLAGDIILAQRRFNEWKERREHKDEL